jgi:hypothetical protein
LTAAVRDGIEIERPGRENAPQGRTRECDGLRSAPLIGSIGMGDRDRLERLIGIAGMLNSALSRFDTTNYDRIFAPRDR